MLLLRHPEFFFVQHFAIALSLHASINDELSADS